MSLGDLTLRDAIRPADLQAVELIARETGFFSEEEVAIAAELVREALEKGTASGYAFVFVDRAGELIGYSCHGEVPGTRGSYDLYWIVVSPACQRHGVGRLLLDASEQAVRAVGGRHLYIETSSREQYTPTRSFYLNNGYVEVARLDDFYAPGDGKLIYLKRLDVKAR